MPSRMSAPLGAIDATRGTRWSLAVQAASVRWPTPSTKAPRRGVHPGDHHRTAVDVLDRGPHRAGRPGRRACATWAIGRQATAT